MTRWKAFALHFAVSAAALIGVFAVILLYWYPPALLGVSKAEPLLLTLAGVCLGLGPLLTLIVFRPGKKGLKFDLVVIPLLQTAALLFGLHVVWQSRPAYIVATTDRFHLVFANEIDTASAAKAPSEYRNVAWKGPRQVAAPLPDEPKARMEAMFEAMATGKDIQFLPEKYRSYPGPNRDPMAAAIPMKDALVLASAESRGRLQRTARRHDDKLALALLPLKSTRGSIGVLVDRSDGTIVAFVDIDPWPIFNAALALRKANAPQPAQ